MLTTNGSKLLAAKARFLGRANVCALSQTALKTGGELSSRTAGGVNQDSGLPGYNYGNYAPSISDQGSITERVRYVNTASTAGGNGTTNATSGANRAYPDIYTALDAEATNLIAQNVTLTIYCEGATADPGWGDSFGSRSLYWKTGLANIIKIIGNSSDNGRHQGVWDTNRYRISNSNFNGSLLFSVPNIWVEGIQIENTADNTSTPRACGVGIRDQTQSFDNGSFWIYGCLIRYNPSGTPTTSADNHGIVIDQANNIASSPNKARRKSMIWDNIVWGFRRSGIYFSTNGDESVDLDNNTCVGNNLSSNATNGGIAALMYGSLDSVTIRNNLLASNNVQDYYSESSATAFTTATNNTSDATSPDGASYRNQTPVFQNAGANNYLLDRTDTACIGRGTELTGFGDPQKDIVQHTRSVPWDIGASEPNHLTLTAASGSYAVTGNTINLIKGWKCTVDSGSYSITGNAVTLTYTAGSQNLTITATSGSYAVTGNAINLKAGHTVTATSGSYAITGNAVNLKVGYTIAATSGSYVITGNAINLPINRTITATSGSYAVTGNAINLKVGHTITATSGSYAVTGNAVNLKVGYTIAATSGSYAITGNAANFTKALQLTATSGSYAITGNAINLKVGHTIAAISDSYAITGNAVNLPIGKTITTTSGSYAITGNAVSIYYGKRLAATSGSYAVTGNAINLLKSLNLTATSGSYAVTGNAINLKVGHTITATSGSYAVTGNAINLKVGYTITATSGSYTVTGNEVNFRESLNLTATSGNYAVTGNNANFTLGKSLTATSGSYTITGNAVNLKVGRLLSVTAGSYSLSGQDAFFAKIKLLSAVSGSYAVTGNAANLSSSRKLTATSGSYSITGNATNLFVGDVLMVSSGVYSITGNNVTLKVNRITTATSGSYTATGNAVSLSRNVRLIAASGNYAITGNSATLTLTAGTIQDCFLSSGEIRIQGGHHTIDTKAPSSGSRRRRKTTSVERPYFPVSASLPVGILSVSGIPLKAGITKLNAYANIPRGYIRVEASNGFKVSAAFKHFSSLSPGELYFSSSKVSATAWNDITAEELALVGFFFEELENGTRTWAVK